MKKLAIIDDEADLSEILKLLILTIGKFEVETFSSVSDFLARNEHHSFDIVFSDLNLPGLSGIQCCEKLSSQTKKPKKFILMTGESEIDKQIIENNKIDHCLYKPFGLNSLKICLA